MYRCMHNAVVTNAKLSIKRLHSFSQKQPMLILPSWCWFFFLIPNFMEEMCSTKNKGHSFGSHISVLVWKEGTHFQSYRFFLSPKKLITKSVFRCEKGPTEWLWQPCTDGGTWAVDSHTRGGRCLKCAVFKQASIASRLPMARLDNFEVWRYCFIRLIIHKYSANTCVYVWHWQYKVTGQGWDCSWWHSFSVGLMSPSMREHIWNVYIFLYGVYTYMHTVHKQTYRISGILKCNGEEWLGKKVSKKTP